LTVSTPESGRVGLVRGAREDEPPSEAVEQGEKEKNLVVKERGL
jgi:hypothetical protein